jgi:hypothetical protein
VVDGNRLLFGISTALDQPTAAGLPRLIRAQITDSFPALAFERLDFTWPAIIGPRRRFQNVRGPAIPMFPWVRGASTWR